MANTYSQLYIQTVFAVKYRNAVIEKEWRSELMAVIGNLINETGCKTIIVNGVEDHVHCFFSLVPKLAISDVMQSVKAKSSKWINENGFMLDRFEWQRGFGAFSYNKSAIENVYNYIANQEAHHQLESFKDEYTKLLTEFEVDYDEDYYFEELI
jgi:REP element-mobilizing transposase RayT